MPDQPAVSTTQATVGAAPDHDDASIDVEEHQSDHSLSDDGGGEWDDEDTGDDHEGNEDDEDDPSDEEEFVARALEEADADALVESILPALPAHLKLPMELEHRVLEFDRDWPEVWVVFRLVCKAWCEHIEFLARKRWLPTARFYYPNGFDWTEDDGRMLLDASLTFQSLDEETGLALFEDTECKKKFRKIIGECCLCIDNPDIVLDDRYIFDIPINSLDIRKLDKLRVTVPWRALIASILVEEHTVDKERARLHLERRHETMRMRFRLERKGADIMEMFEKLAVKVNALRGDAYATVRRRRFGEDIVAEKRIDEARCNLSWLQMLAGGEDEEEEEEGAKKLRITFSDDEDGAEENDSDSESAEDSDGDDAEIAN